MKTNQYVVVSFLGKQPVGKRWHRSRHEWPLHVTLVPWFTTSDVGNIYEVLEASAALCPLLEVTVAEMAQFGPDTRVSLIADQEGLGVLHGALLATLQESGVELQDVQWIGEHYQAHVTHHAGQDNPETGTVLQLASISIVKQIDHDRCEIMHNFILGGAQ